jgi:hypothetical protein
MSYKSFLEFTPVIYDKCDRGWLSPDLKFYPCSMHEEWAWEYLRELYDNDEDGSNWDKFHEEIVFKKIFT